jgi:hypothetical protein
MITKFITAVCLAVFPTVAMAASVPMAPLSNTNNNYDRMSISDKVEVHSRCAALGGIYTENPNETIKARATTMMEQHFLLSATVQKKALKEVTFQDPKIQHYVELYVGKDTSQLEATSKQDIVYCQDVGLREFERLVGSLN